MSDSRITSGETTFHLAKLAEATAELAGAAGIRDKLLAPYDQRRDALEGFDAAGARIGRESGRRMTVADGTRAHSAIGA